MENDEIKRVLKQRVKIKHDGITYDYAQAWRVAYDHRHHGFVSSLELVKQNHMVIALAEKCEAVES